jgi:hypothetical protein
VNNKIPSSLLPFLLLALVSGCSGGGGGGGSSPSTPQPTSPALPATISIIIDQPFTNTNIPVSAGETLTVTASGSLNYSTNNLCDGSQCIVTPAGDPYSSCQQLTGFTAPGLPCWSLIGKIGENGTIFEVGTSYHASATATGTLYLGINDNDYLDNGGSWTAVVNETGS